MNSPINSLDSPTSTENESTEAEPPTSFIPKAFGVTETTVLSVDTFTKAFAFPLNTFLGKLLPSGSPVTPAT